MPFPTADALTLNTHRNITVPRRPVRPVRYIFYIHNFMIAQYSVNSYEYKL